MLALQLVFVFVLIILNGFLSMSELAVVSSRPARLKALANSGRRGAARALALTESPGSFLSTVQIGITLVGVLTGALSGATLADPLSAFFRDLGLAGTLSHPLALAVVVSVITFLSLILGELVPKQLALRDAESVASMAAGPLSVVSRLARPFVYVLDASTYLVLRLLGAHEEPAQRVTDEEIRTIIAEAESAGVVEPAEKAMIAGVMRLGDRPVRALMTPRPDVEWVDLNAAPDEIRATIRNTRHSRLPAARDSIDDVEGIIQTKDLLDAYLDGRDVDPREMVRRVPAVPDGMDALDVIEVLRTSDANLALVVDEYGSFEGIVTTDDILETIAGEFRQAGEPDEASFVRRADGSYLVDGAMPVDEMAELLGLTLPEDIDYHTVAGFMLSELKHVPTTGEDVVSRGWRFEVVDMDGRRIDKVLASRA